MNELHVKMVEMIPRQECRERLGRGASRVHEHSVCAVSPSGVAACRGDAGGPLTTENGVVIAMSSYRLDCRGNRPDVYVRLYPLLKFIRNHINNA